MPRSNNLVTLHEETKRRSTLTLSEHSSVEYDEYQIWDDTEFNYNGIHIDCMDFLSDEEK